MRQDSPEAAIKADEEKASSDAPERPSVKLAVRFARKLSCVSSGSRRVSRSLAGISFVLNRQ